jgi:hypothetical protein
VPLVKFRVIEIVGIPVTLKTPVLLSILKLFPTFIPPRVEEEAIGSSLVGISYVLLPIYKYFISPIKAIFFLLTPFFYNLYLY